MERGTIVVETNRCKGCELCTTVCPQNVLAMSDSFNARGYKPAVLIDPEGKCTGCGLCAVICPDAVIAVFRLSNVSRVSRAPLPVAQAMAA
ncbi:MAG: 4Fe-4S dicluster domain-containing protein [Caldilineales bacterium]